MDDEYKTIECANINQIPESMKVLIDDLELRVIPNQNLTDKSWNHIRFEIWEDSGRIIAFPADTNRIDRIDKFGTQIVCEEVIETVYKIDGLGVEDNELDQKMQNLVNDLAHLIKSNIKADIEFSYKIYNQDGFEVSTT